jgi:hypothetical protein
MPAIKNRLIALKSMPKGDGTDILSPGMKCLRR